MTMEGQETVLRNLRRLDKQMRGTAMRGALAAAAAEAEGHVKVNARKEFYDAERGQTGNLMGSIGSATTFAGKPESAVFVGAEYGVFLEEGTSTGIRARHYLKRGVRDNKDKITRAAVVTLKRLLGL